MREVKEGFGGDPAMEPMRSVIPGDRIGLPYPGNHPSDRPIPWNTISCVAFVHNRSIL